MSYCILVILLTISCPKLVIYNFLGIWESLFKKDNLYRIGSITCVVAIAKRDRVQISIFFPLFWNF